MGIGRFFGLAGILGVCIRTLPAFASEPWVGMISHRALLPAGSFKRFLSACRQLILSSSRALLGNVMVMVATPAHSERLVEPLVLATSSLRGAMRRVNSIGKMNFVDGLCPMALRASRYWRAMVFGSTCLATS